MIDGKLLWCERKGNHILIHYTRLQNMQLNLCLAIRKLDVLILECIPVGCIPPTLQCTGSLCQGGSLFRGVSVHGGLCQGGISVEGDLQTWTPPEGTWDQEARQELTSYTDPPLSTEWQTCVKILPCPKLCLRAVNIYLHKRFINTGYFFIFSFKK